MFSAARSSTGLFRNCIHSLNSQSSPVYLRCANVGLLGRHGLGQASNYATLGEKSIPTKKGAGKEKTAMNTALSRTTTIFKKYKPTSPGIRHLRRPLVTHLYEGRPVRLLTIPRRKKGGRNAHGVITVRHRGGGHKQRIRTLDFTREAPGPHDVVRIEYDPGRSAHIALVRNRDPDVLGTDKWSYIIATEGLRAGDVVQSFRQGIPKGFIPEVEMDDDERAELEEYNKSQDGTVSDTAQKLKLAVGVLRTLTVKPGNVLPLKLIPPGTIIHNVCLSPIGPGRLVRSAGTWGQVVIHEEKGKYTHVRLQSGEVRKVLQECCATVGKVSNATWKDIHLGKAGRARWMGWRPSVRGVAMNAYVALA